MFIGGLGMDKSILQYQKAFNTIIERLKSNESVLAVMVFGSMVTGDLWDESDIDLFVILDKKMPEIKNIYTLEKEVPIHIKLMSKSKFVQLYDEDSNRGGFLHRVIAASKLVFSKDIEITTKYDNGRYFTDIDRKRWNMTYLGNLLKNVGVCKKYLSNDGIYTSYSVAVRCVEEYSKLYVNFYGYMISKDAMAMAMNLNEGFKRAVDKLFFDKGDIVAHIEEMVEFIQNSVDESLRDICDILIDYMREKDCFLSAEDIKRDKLFQNFEVSIEEILHRLWEKNIIKKENRDYKTEDGKILFKENVYFI